MDWVMGCMLVLTRVVPMGLWVVWRRAEMLGMGEGVAWGYQVEEMLVVIIFEDMSLWNEWILETDREVVVGEAMVIVWGIW